MDSLGNAYLVGHDTISKPLADVFLMKVDGSNGHRVWNTTWGGPYDEEGLKVTVNSGRSGVIPFGQPPVPSSSSAIRY